MLVALMALLLTGCRDSPTGADPIPWPTPSNQNAPLDDPSGYADEFGGHTDEPGTAHACALVWSEIVSAAGFSVVVIAAVAGSAIVLAVIGH
jgi:hypothetical protein